MPDPLIIGVDLGATNIESAAVRGGDILASDKKKTRPEKGVDAVIERIAKTVRNTIDDMDASKDDFEALCIGAPGAVDIEAGVIKSAPNLGWTNVPLGDLLEEELEMPVLVDNDVNIGVLGEHVYGAGKGTLDMIGIFVGTGIGGGLVLNGTPHYGWRGVAGEVGHVVVKPNGRQCGCGRYGCVEAYASKTAMEAIIREEMEKGRSTEVFEIMEKKGKQKLTSSVIEASLEAGDLLMEEAIQNAQYYLGLLTANLVNVLDPEVVVFGGGVVERLGQDFIDPIGRTARQHYLQREGAEKIRLVPAALGDDAGPIGAGVVARRRLQSAI
ncbi:ROK family protein [Longibacter salinarum]|uniref:ROK family protein n=1 Tax=Longibacter salinarum TaxID=1850348 RepID=A0A2A8CUQ4_9BACT|nr:ROK family protein [Longibacter salinarum]PEN11486.1 ROK family protein [Longibacter salinarum]